MADVGSDRLRGRARLATHEVRIAVHLEQRANERRVMAGAQSQVDAPRLELTVGMSDSDRTGCARAVEGVRRAFDSQSCSRQSDRLTRHAEVELARRKPLVGVLDLRFDLFVPERKTATRGAVVEAAPIRGEPRDVELGVPASQEERRYVKSLLAMPIGIERFGNAHQILAGIEIVHATDGVRHLLDRIRFQGELRLPVSQLLPELLAVVAVRQDHSNAGHHDLVQGWGRSTDGANFGGRVVLRLLRAGVRLSGASCILRHVALPYRRLFHRRSRHQRDRPRKTHHPRSDGSDLWPSTNGPRTRMPHHEDDISALFGSRCELFGYQLDHFHYRCGEACFRPKALIRTSEPFRKKVWGRLVSSGQRAGRIRATSDRGPSLWRQKSSCYPPFTSADFEFAMGQLSPGHECHARARRSTTLHDLLYVVTVLGGPSLESVREGGAMTHLLPLQVQSVSVAIDARQVQEIMGQRAAVFLPGARSEIPGVVAWRGRAVGVFDFAAVTDGLTPLDEGPPRSRTLVVQVGANTLAVPVDAVREVREVTDECIRAPRVTAQKFAAAEVELDGVVMPIFDFAAFIDSIVVDEPMALAPMAKG